MTRYEVVNMFADRPFAGSPLTVVPDADGLTPTEMAAIARETGSDETTFVLPASQPGASYRVRVFNPGGESPYGGHSSLGTATTMVRIGAVAAGRVIQECGPVLVPIDATAEEGTIGSTASTVAAELDPTALLEACGLPRNALTDAPPMTAGLGAAFTFIPVHDSALSQAEPRFKDIEAAGFKDVFLFSWNAEERYAHARMFAPGYGIPEDPACASAGFGLGVWLVRAGFLPDHDGTYGYDIHQGVEMNRPSTVRCTVSVQNGRIVSATVAGGVIAVAGGEFHTFATRRRATSPTAGPTTRI